MQNLAVFMVMLFLCFSCKDEPHEPILSDPTPMLATFEGEIGAHDNSTILSNDNHLLICGNTPNGICILKISKSGAQIWRQDIASVNGRMASGITQSPGNDIFICGTDYAKSDILLVKTNSSGDTLWTKTYGGPYEDYGDYIISLSDASILICGRTCKSAGGANCGAFLMKLNTNGDTIWTRSFIEEDYIIPYHLLQTQTGEILITGMALAPPFDRKFYMLKVSSEGSLLWQKTHVSTLDQWGSSTVELPNGDLITCGGAADTGYNQILVVKTDGQGNILWEKQYGEVYLSEIAESIVFNFDGTFTMTGGSMEAHSGQREVLILKIDQAGNQLLKKGFGRTLIDFGNNILKDDNNDNLITGEYNGNIFLTRTDNNCVFK